MSTFITNRQWEAAFRRIEKANMKAHGRSMTAVSMMNNTRGIVVVVEEDRGGLMVRNDWRDELKRLFLVPARLSHQDQLWIVLRLDDQDRILQTFEYDTMEEARDSFDEEVQDFGHRAALLPKWLYNYYEQEAQPAEWVQSEGGDNG